MRKNSWLRGLTWTMMVMMGIALNLHADPFSDQVDSFNEKGFGKVSGKLQLFLMRRNWDNKADPDGDQNSGTLALTLNYQTPEVLGLSGGVQFIHSEELFDAGSRDANPGDAYSLGNAEFTIVNELYAKLSLKELGLEKTFIKGGRQVLNLDFVRSYPVRQKAQSYESVIFCTEDIKNVSLTLGHIERFSAWRCRDDGDVWGPDVDFQDMDDVAGTGYDTDGLQLGSVTYTGIPRTSITVYDVYGNDLFNTFGAKGSFKIIDDEDFSATAKAHYISQRDVGKYDDIAEGGNGDIRADLIDVALQLKKGNFAIEPGLTSLRGGSSDSNPTVNDLMVPFRTSLVIDYSLLWYTNQFDGGTDSYYVKSTYKYGKTKFYLLYILADHEKRTRGGALDQEVNVVISHAWTDNFYTTVKAGYGFRDNKAGARDTQAEDCRLFVGYTF